MAQTTISMFALQTRAVRSDEVEVCKKKHRMKFFFAYILNYYYLCSMKRILLLAEEGDLIGEKKLIEKYLNASVCGNKVTMPDGSEWTIVVSGVGAVNVIRALSAYDATDTEVLNIGYAGSANFPINTAVVVNEVKLNHPNCSYPEPALSLSPVPAEWLKHDHEVLTACNYSGADFVLASDYRDCTFDMELAYIAAFGFRRLYALKIVSDNLSLHDYRQVAAGVDGK